MPSRKRNKGRARKLKASGVPPRDNPQQRLRQGQDLGMIPSFQRFGLNHGRNGNCVHGYPPADRPGQSPWTIVCNAFHSIFANEMYEQHGNAMTAAATALFGTHDGYPEILNNVTNRKMTVSHLLPVPTHILLKDDSSDRDFDLALASGYAAAIILLETFEQIEGDVDEKQFMNNRDVIRGCRRSLIQFFSKRIPCSCLDEKYAEAKSQPKTGLCDLCDDRQERRSLMICTRCRRQQYCSRECQVADWPAHKEICDSVSGK